MTGGDIAGLIAAGVFAILVALLALPIIRLTKVFDELIVTIRSLNQSTGPLIEEVTRTVVTLMSSLRRLTTSPRTFRMLPRTFRPCPRW